MYLCVDIGGTKTLLSRISKNGEIEKSVRFETPKQYNDFIATLEQTFQQNSFADNYAICVVGAPGKIDRENGIGLVFGNLDWENVPIAADVSKITSTKTIVENDANLAGLSEAILVADKYRKVLYITISTGIGGVLIVDKKIDPELADTEFGHMVIEHEGKLLEWEDFASGRAIYERYGKPAKDINDEQTWHAISRDVSLGLVNVISTLTPEAVVVGGGVGSHFEKFKDILEDELKKLVSNTVSLPVLIKAQRAEEAVLYGCYELAKQHI